MKREGRTRIVNRRASFDYFLYDRLEAGLSLLGPEVKSVKMGRASLSGSYAKVIGGEAFLVNAFIAPYGPAGSGFYDARRTRKLLLHKNQTIFLLGKMAGQGLTVVPTAMYVRRGFVKVELALAKGKRKWDKREAIKEKDLVREEETGYRGKK